VIGRSPADPTIRRHRGRRFEEDLMRRISLTGLALLVGLAGAVLSPVGPARAAAKDPVVFVHGYASTGSVWNTMISRFRAAGYSSSQLYAFTYSYNQSNATSASQLGAFVDNVRARTGAAKVDLVNHSMGGLVTRYYVKNLGGTATVDQWGSLAGANHGTTAASACATYPSCREMVPGSAFLTQLNSGDETPGAVAYRTWYSSCDGVINPYTSTALAGATNTNPGCVTHSAFLSNQTVATQLIAWLD
jgi:triacylglycerol lipase